MNPGQRQQRPQGAALDRSGRAHPALSATAGDRVPKCSTAWWPRWNGLTLAGGQRLEYSGGQRHPRQVL